MIIPEHNPQFLFAMEVIRRLRSAGFTALLAGGCVRDLLLERAADDFDVATSAHPDQVRQLFGKERTLEVGASFGVVMIKGGRRRGMIEVATFRTEGDYSDGRRPDNVSFSTPEEDACRRDFTINGMFFDPIAQKVLDFVDGQADLDRRLIRAIGNPAERIREDKLRMLRAVRFAATLEFELDPATATAVREAAAEVSVVSAERIAQELRKMLSDVHRPRSARLMEELGLLAVVLPEFGHRAEGPRRESWNLTLAILTQLTQPGFELGMAALLHSFYSAETAGTREDVIEMIGRRLRLSNDERQTISRLLMIAGQVRGLRQQPLSKLKRLLASPNVAEGLDLASAWAESVADGDWLEDAQYASDQLHGLAPEQINPPPLLSGHDLRQLGHQPGMAFKIVLDAVRDAQLNGEIRTSAEAIQLAIRLFKDHPA